jgi:hypothetical protein
LGGVLDLGGKEDSSGTGAEGGGLFDEGFEDVEEVIAFEELEHGGGLAAGHDEAVDAFEVCRGADEFGGCTEEAEGLGVGLVCALQREDADGEGIGHD